MNWCFSQSGQNILQYHFLPFFVFLFLRHVFLFVFLPWRSNFDDLGGRGSHISFVRAPRLQIPNRNESNLFLSFFKFQHIWSANLNIFTTKILRNWFADLKISTAAWLRKAHMYPTLSFRSFLNVAFKTVPVLVSLTMALSHLLKIKC